MSSDARHSPSKSQAGPRLRQVLLSISRQAECDLDLLPSGNPHTHIHALRVRMKKLRAFMRLIEPGIAPSTMAAIRRHIRTIKGSFAMGRDQHVVNALLAELNHGKVASPNGCNVNGVLPGDEQLLRLKATAHALTHRLETMKLRPMSWDDVAKVYALRYKKAVHWFRRCGRKATEARLHRWRAPVKDHYFQSLFLLRRRKHINAARKLGSLLGKFHDLAMLREHYDHRSSSKPSKATDGPMKKLREHIFTIARQLFALTPKKIERQVHSEHCA